MQGQALISPRHLRAAVLKYDRHFNSRDLRWSDFSILQKLLYLFENQRQPLPLRVETHASGGGSTSLNHRVSRLTNPDLVPPPENSNFKSQQSGMKTHMHNMIGSIEISEIKQFIENFRNEDQLERHNKAMDLLLED